RPKTASSAPSSGCRTSHEQVLHRNCLTRRILCLTFASRERKSYANQQCGRGGTGRRKGLKISGASLETLEFSGNNRRAAPSELPPNQPLLETLAQREIPVVVERDDGMWSIGWQDDAAGPFPTRAFAAAVAAKVAA